MIDYRNVKLFLKIYNKDYSILCYFNRFFFFVEVTNKEGELIFEDKYESQEGLWDALAHFEHYGFKCVIRRI